LQRVAERYTAMMGVTGVQLLNYWLNRGERTAGRRGCRRRRGFSCRGREGRAPSRNEPLVDPGRAARVAREAGRLL